MAEPERTEKEAVSGEVDPLSVGLTVFFVALIVLVAGLLVFQTL